MAPIVYISMGTTVLVTTYGTFRAAKAARVVRKAVIIDRDVYSGNVTLLAGMLDRVLSNQGGFLGLP
jgi:hypothetical protein